MPMTCTPDRAESDDSAVEEGIALEDADNAVKVDDVEDDDEDDADDDCTEVVERDEADEAFKPISTVALSDLDSGQSSPASRLAAQPGEHASTSCLSPNCSPTSTSASKCTGKSPSSSLSPSSPCP